LFHFSSFFYNSIIRKERQTGEIVSQLKTGEFDLDQIPAKRFVLAITELINQISARSLVITNYFSEI